MTRAAYRILLLAASLVVLAVAAPAQPLSVHAFVDRNVAAVGEPVTYTLEIRGATDRISQVEPPRSAGMSLAQRSPGRQTSVSIVNGVRTSMTRLTWVLIPDREGAIDIDPVEVTIEGRTYLTDRVTVRVVPATQRPSTQPAPPPGDFDEAPREIFLAAVPDTSTAYVGQQVRVDFLLYYLPQLSPRNARATGSWDAPGFWREEFELAAPVQAQQVMIDGRAYQAAVIKQTAFFPTRSGELHIDPLTITIDVLRGQQIGGPGGTFFNPFASRYSRQSISSEEVRIRVLPLPGGAPASFSGAVGSYEMEVSPSPTQNPEAVGARVRISGNGNPATLDPPQWPEVDGVEAFPPRITNDVDRAGEAIFSRHDFEYVFVPGPDAPHELPPLEWTYFDPMTATYRTLASRSLPLPTGRAPGVASQAGPSDPIVSAPVAWRSTDPSGPLSPGWILLAGGVPPLLAAVALIFSKAVSRRRSASAALNEARSALRGQPDPAVVDRAVRRFLSRRMSLDAGGMTRRELISDLERRHLPSDAVDTVAAALRWSDEARFAGGAHSTPAPDVLPALAAIDRLAT